MSIWKSTVLIVLGLILALFTTTQQSIPTISIDNPLLNAPSNYIMSYFSLQKLTNSSYIQIDFSLSDIGVNDGSLNVTVNLNGSPMNTSALTSNCISKVCIIRFGTSVNANTNIQTTLGLLTNPKFTASEKVTVLVYFAANSNDTQTVTLSSSIYTPVPVIVNSVNQSDYGVGSNNVTYTFNVSFTYVPPNPEITILIPSEVGYANIDTKLIFYGAYQNITPFLTSNMIILSVVSSQIPNPNGFMLLTLYGFQNPNFIGNSSSFNITVVQKKTPLSNNCGTCVVAFLHSNSSSLLIVNSQTPGDIKVTMFNPSSYLVSSNISLTIGVKILAPIPVGGKFRIILPASITPSFPVTCAAVYGFTLSNPFSCNYNATHNTIQTVGFSIPYLVSTGDAIISINVVNAKDNRPTYFNFQSLDELDRKIGKSRTPFLYTAVPLTLDANVSKNSTSIESPFTLSANITLTEQMNVTTDLVMVTLPPSNYYNLSAIRCVVSSNIVPCGTSFDNSSNLIVTFSPPCSTICNSSTVIPFMINNLINPSFINDEMQNIQIQTLSSFGVMQAFDSTITLQQKQLIITQLNWTGNQTVGSQYQLVLGFQIPRYIQSNGGYLLINFDPNSTYLNIVMNGTSYTYPQSISVINENNQSLSNTLTYYNASDIWSLQQIKVKMCTTDSPCGSVLNITVLRKSFYPLQSAVMIIKAQTLNNEPMATSTNDVSSFMPQISVQNLSVSSSISVTNTISNYVMKLRMNRLPFDSGLRIDLPAKTVIQQTGKCFLSLFPSTALGYGIDCNVLNSSSIVLTYTGDIALMTASVIDYNLTIVNVLNPPSIMPTTYKIEPTFNSIKIGTFSTSYVIALPYTLAANQLSLSNTTYGQATNLTMKLATGYYAFDEMIIYVPKTNFQAFYSLLSGVNLTSSIYNVTQNATYLMLQQIYSLDSTFTLKLQNALNTSAASNITVEMYVQGYLSSTGTFTLPRITPVYLYCAVSSSDRFVGENSSLLFDIRRVNAFSQQQSIMIFFNNTVFSVSTANQLFTANPNNSQLYSYSEALSAWTNTSKLLNLSTFQNMKFIPNPQTSSTLPKLNVSTFDQHGSIVASTLIDLTNILPNQTKDSISYAFTRTNIKSLNNTNIVLNIVPRYPDMAVQMKIDLPSNQNKFTNSSSCVIGDETSTTPCKIVTLQQLSMTIQYPVNQTQITLLNVLNQFPSSNNLTITLMTQLSELIEQSSASIMPKISLDPLIVTATSNTSIVSSPSQLILTITSPEIAINSGSAIVLTLPNEIYSRVSTFALPDCLYQVSSNNYTGCTYTHDQLNDGKDWIQAITVNFTNNIQILPNTTFQLIVYLINPSTSYQFSALNITAALYNAIGQVESIGVVMLSSIYQNLTGFTPAQMTTYALQQTSIQCSQTDTLTFSITLPINVATQTYLYFIIPTAYYMLVNQSGYQIVQQNTSFYTLRRLITECTQTFTSSGLCMKAGDVLNSTISVTNQPYLMLLDTKLVISFYLSNDNYSVTSSSDIKLNDRVPNSITSTILQRNTGNVSSSVISTLQFTLPSTFNISNPLRVSVKSTNSTIGFINSIQSFQFTTQNSTITQTNLSYSSTLNGKQMILSTTYSPTHNVQIQINGVNPSYAPNVDNQTYTVKIFDDNFVYFVTNSTLTTESRLKPLSDGLSLVRSNVLVNTLANYDVSGTLTNPLLNARLIFNQTTSIPVPSSINFNNFTIGRFLNPLSSNWVSHESVSIVNNTHILYSNNRIKTTPFVESLAMPANSVVSILYNADMQINTHQTVTVVFGSALSNTSRINIKLPTFFKLVIGCRINSSSVPTPCTSTPLSPTSTMLQIPTSPLISNISFTVLTQDYQTIVTNQTITIQTQYPTESYQQSFGVNIWGASINSSLQMTSYKVNDQSNIVLNVVPLVRSGSEIVVYLPTYLNQQLQSIQSNDSSATSSTMKLMQGTVQHSLNLQFNSTINTYFFTLSLNQSLLTQNLSLTLSNMLNPISNQPFYFVIQQQDSNNNIFGHSTVQVQMTVLQQIYIRSTERNTSKIGVDVEINIQIQLPSNLTRPVLQNLSQEQCIIEMPSVQVIRLPLTNSCSVLLIGNNTNTSLPCQMHPNITNAIITSCSPGLNNYVIKRGFINMAYSMIPNARDKPYVVIGSPYQMAESSIISTPLMSPIMTSGSLYLNSLTSSSSVRLQGIILSLNMTLQNVQQVDCINFTFGLQNYIYSTSDLKCTSNGQSAECWSNQMGTIMINISSIKSKSQYIRIEGLYNYIVQQNFTIMTLKYLENQALHTRLLTETTLQNVQSASSASFGLIDIFYSAPSDLGPAFTSNSYNIRVVLPNNYVSQEQQQIMVFFDDVNLIPSSLSKSLLQFNVTSNIPSCKLLNEQFSTSFTFNCMFNQSINFNLAIGMFDKTYPDINLAQNSYTTFIYPALSSSCKNQMCNKCSTASDGTQKCFSCRQNYYEYQNGCAESCPNGFTEYDTSMSCEKCSTYCSTCYGLFWNNCLQCQNTTLVSQNGQCTENCSQGYAQNGYCIGDKDCFDQGCRLCSTNGFCYQCLPDYIGAPQCKWEQLLPSLFMSFFAAPFLVYAIVSIIYFLAVKGVLAMTNQVIFAFSLLQFSVWVFIIPALHTKEQAMVLLSLIIFRIVNGIVAYETFYKRQINSHIGVNQEDSLLQHQKSSQKDEKHEKQSSKELQGESHFDEDWKTRLIRFLTHINGIDSYEEFKVLFMEKIRIEHNNMYLWLSTVNRLVVCVVMFYVLSQLTPGDLTIMPVVAVVSSVLVLFLRLAKSEKFQKAWEKIRHPTK